MRNVFQSAYIAGGKNYGEMACDVTEFKWYESIEVHKLYRSAILNPCDRRIVFYVSSERNLFTKPLTRLLRQIQMLLLCFIAIELSTTNSYRLECLKVCPPYRKMLGYPEVATLLWQTFCSSK